MEDGESILGAIFEEDNSEDVDMLDVEEGELVEENPRTEPGHSNVGDVNIVDQASRNGKRRRRKNKKNKKKKSVSAPPITDINRFVSDACRRLKEKKSYMVYTAVGCLGVSALSDLIKEVDAIQACGGQMTADGRRHRTGGGILWSIIKTREPKAYKEIMRRAAEFEKQFRQQNIRRAPNQNNEATSQGTVHAFSNGTAVSPSDGSELVPDEMESCVEGKRVSVHDRMRVPVKYDDLFGEVPPKEEST